VCCVWKDMPKSHGHHWWYTYPSKKYESQIGSSSQLLGKINVPNHQPVILSYQNCHCMEYGDPPFSETPKEPDSMSRYLNSASIASFKRCNQKKIGLVLPCYTTFWTNPWHLIHSSLAMGPPHAQRQQPAVSPCPQWYFAGPGALGAPWRAMGR
jgi:hypothetical protein